jgi:type III restriction enzyme
LAGEIINRQKRMALVGGIKYQRLGDEHFYAQELFEREELTGYLKNLMDAEKSVYEKVVYDSATESDFAGQLEMNTSIKVYAKLDSDSRANWTLIPRQTGQ